MTTTEAFVEEARPSDIEALAALHLSSLPPAESLSSAFGPAFVRAAYRGFLADPTFLVLVARLGDRVVGFTSLAERPYTLRMLRRGWSEALEGVLRHPSVLFHSALLARLRHLVLGRGPTFDGAAQVAFTVVAPEARGRGIGSMLKRASIEECRRRGYSALLTGIHRSNTASQRLNEAAGFVEVPELRTAEFRYYLMRLRPVGQIAELDERAIYGVD